MTSRCPRAWICQASTLCLSHKQMMPKVATFCHHASPKRGQEKKYAMNHAPARGAYSFLASSYTTSTPTAWVQIISQEKGNGEHRKKGKLQGPRSGQIHSGGRIVCPEENSPALGAKHVCARMGFKNSNRTLSVLKGLM